MTESNSKILKFLKAYKEWAEDDAPIPNEHGFDSRYGLCSNLEIFGGVYNQSGFRRLLKSHPGYEKNEGMPFGGYDVYIDESFRGAHHKNPERMAWVAKAISELSI